MVAYICGIPFKFRFMQTLPKESLRWLALSKSVGRTSYTNKAQQIGPTDQAVHDAMMVLQRFTMTITRACSYLPTLLSATYISYERNANVL